MKTKVTLFSNAVPNEFMRRLGAMGYKIKRETSLPAPKACPQDDGFSRDAEKLKSDWNLIVKRND